LEATLLVLFAGVELLEAALHAGLVLFVLAVGLVFCVTSVSLAIEGHVLDAIGESVGGLRGLHVCRRIL
jgi:hypothetical protein